MPAAARFPPSNAGGCTLPPSNANSPRMTSPSEMNMFHDTMRTPRWTRIKRWLACEDIAHNISKMECAFAYTFPTPWVWIYCGCSLADGGLRFETPRPTDYHCALPSGPRCCAASNSAETEANPTDSGRCSSIPGESRQRPGQVRSKSPIVAIAPDRLHSAEVMRSPTNGGPELTIVRCFRPRAAPPHRSTTPCAVSRRHGGTARYNTPCHTPP